MCNKNDIQNRIKISIRQTDHWGIIVSRVYGTNPTYLRKMAKKLIKNGCV